MLSALFSSARGRLVRQWLPSVWYVGQPATSNADSTFDSALCELSCGVQGGWVGRWVLAAQQHRWMEVSSVAVTAHCRHLWTEAINDVTAVKAKEHALSRPALLHGTVQRCERIAVESRYTVVARAVGDVCVLHITDDPKPKEWGCCLGRLTACGCGGGHAGCNCCSHGAELNAIDSAKRVVH